MVALALLAAGNGGDVPDGGELAFWVGAVYEGVVEGVTSERLLLAHTSVSWEWVKAVCRALGVGFGLLQTMLFEIRSEYKLGNAGLPDPGVFGGQPEGRATSCSRVEKDDDKKGVAAWAVLR